MQAAEPGRFQRLRARYEWLDHVARAAIRYDKAKGDFYAAGVTYFTIFALFPLLMVGFATGGVMLAGRPALMAEIEHRIRSTVSGEFGQQLVALMDSAIDSRTSLGLIGFATAAWVGLSWVNRLRDALSQMWEQREEDSGFVATKLSDLTAMVSVFIAVSLSLALTVVSDPAVMRTVLRWAGFGEAPGLGNALQDLSRVLSWMVIWLLFTWMIARLPRQSLSLRSSIRAGLLASLGFELFKAVGAVYLQAVMHGPAGVTFGPVLGLMVFAYFTARLVLFSTAWAATAAPEATGKAVGADGADREADQGVDR